MLVIVGVLLIGIGVVSFVQVVLCCVVLAILMGVSVVSVTGGIIRVARLSVSVVIAVSLGMGNCQYGCKRSRKLHIKL